MRAFLAIANLWGLTEEQRRLIFSIPPRSTFHALGHSRARARCTGSRSRHAAAGFRRTGRASGSGHAVRHQAGGDRLATHPTRRAGVRRPATAGETQDGLPGVHRFFCAARGGLYITPNTLDAEAAPLTDAGIIVS
jgi:hypothetical protein